MSISHRAIVGVFSFLSVVGYGTAPSSAQVAVVGGSSTLGISAGFGGFGSSSITGYNSIFVTPGGGYGGGLSVGTVTPYPIGFGGYSVAPYYGGYGPYDSFGNGGYGYGGYGYGGYGRFGYGGYAPYGYYGRPYFGGFALPPLVLPAETLYGPGPVRRMMGLDPPLGTPVVNNTTIINGAQQAGGFGVLAPGAPVPARPAGVRPSNAAAQDRSKKLVAQGDGWFGRREYAQALDSYKQAARAAPDLADAYLRQMTALVALGRYDDAVSTLKSGLRLSTASLNGEFRIAGLYGEDNQMSLVAHREALATAAAQGESSDLYFLTGVLLFFDNPPQRSAPFLERASATALGERWHIDVFREVLKRLAARGPAPQNPQQPAVRNEGAPVRPAVAAGHDGAREI